MTQDEIIEMAGHRQVSAWVIKLVADAVAKEREHWKEIVEGQLRCITALNDIVGGEGSTTTKNILDYSRMEERIKEAVAKEREACESIEYDLAKSPAMFATIAEYKFYRDGVEKYRAAIRARGQHD